MNAFIHLFIFIYSYSFIHTFDAFTINKQKINKLKSNII